LAGAVVWVLAEDYNLDVVERAFIESCKNAASGRVDARVAVSFPYECGQLFEVWFFPFMRQRFFPTFLDSYVHN
jgi:hypothetical protein